MATAQEVIKGALQRILVQGSEADLEPDEYQDAINDLNEMMLAYDADGIRLGYTLVGNLSDKVTVPSGALMGIKANLAILLAPDYNKPVSKGLEMAAARGEDVMRKLASDLSEASYPYTLPVGSGNEDSGALTSGAPFYPDEEDMVIDTYGLLSMKGVYVTTIDSVFVPVLMNGIWSIDQEENMTGTSGGRLTYDGEDTATLNVTATLSLSPAGASDVIGASIAKNGSEIANSRSYITSIYGQMDQIVVIWQVEMDEDDYIEVYLLNTTSTNNINVLAATLRATL
jgi:hypothetical protein